MILTCLDCKTYRNSGSWGTPTGVEVDDIRDLTLQGEWSTAEFKKRAYQDTLEKPTTRKRGAEGVFEHAPGIATSDANYDAFRDAFLNREQLELFILNGDISTTGNEGLHAHFYVTKWERTETLEDAVVHNFTLVLASDHASGEAPEWYEVP